MFICKVLKTRNFIDWRILTMAQKSIKSFFTSTQGTKRKHEEISSDEPEDVQSSCERTLVIDLAKQKPALSANIGLSWFKALKQEFYKEYFHKLSQFMLQERKSHTIYPPEKDVYSWTNACKINEVKVVILGQDPYHGVNQAHGLAFSVRKGIPTPKSLLNMYAELATDISGFVKPQHGYLYGWATQGVLLLNTCLTVRAENANSHRNAKWELFTDAVIKWIDANLKNVVFMLWGNNAKEKIQLINKNRHLVLTAAHPSPLAAHRGFFGCKHFSKANEYLEKHGKKSIDWCYLP